MSAEAVAYPKLSKIYQELNKQNGIIFDAERERNALELERDSLKRLARLTKKGELQSKIDRKNEEIDLLKIGLSGIAKRYGFKTVHDFYKAFAAAKYQTKADKWEELYGENAQKQEKKVYTDGYRIIKGKMQIGNQNQPYKEKTEERDNYF